MHKGGEKFCKLGGVKGCDRSGVACGMGMVVMGRKKKGNEAASMVVRSPSTRTNADKDQ